MMFKKKKKKKKKGVWLLSYRGIEHPVKIELTSNCQLAI